MFDPNQFLDATINESGDTTYTPVPEGEYTAIIDKTSIRSFAGKQDPTKTFVSLDVTWEIDDQKVKDFLERDRITVQQSLFLDVNPQGGIDMGKGKNIPLNRLRAALDLNVPGFSFSQLVGRVAKVRVKHRLNQNDEPVAEVAGVAKLG